MCFPVINHRGVKMTWGQITAYIPEAAPWQLLRLHLEGEKSEHLSPASVIWDISVGSLKCPLSLFSPVSAAGPWVWTIPWSATLRNPPSTGSPSIRCLRNTCRNKQKSRKVTPICKFPAYWEGPGWAQNAAGSGVYLFPCLSPLLSHKLRHLRAILEDSA